jgi:hypothetical protein
LRGGLQQNSSPTPQNHGRFSRLRRANLIKPYLFAEIGYNTCLAVAATGNLTKPYFFPESAGAPT